MKNKGGKKLPTILSNKRVIGSTEVDEPIPIAAFPQQNGRSVQCVGHHSRASVGNKIGLLDDLDISKLVENRVIPHVFLQIQPLVRRRFEVQMQDVAINRMVQSFKRPFQHIPFSDRAGD